MTGSFFKESETIRVEKRWLEESHQDEVLMFLSKQLIFSNWSHLC